MGGAQGKFPQEGTWKRSAHYLQGLWEGPERQSSSVARGCRAGLVAATPPHHPCLGRKLQALSLSEPPFYGG